MRVRFDKSKADILGSEYSSLTHGKIYDVEHYMEWKDDLDPEETMRYMLYEDDHDEQEPYDIRVFDVITDPGNLPVIPWMDDDE